MAQEFENADEVKRFLEQQSRLLNDGAITQADYKKAIADAKVGIKGFSAALESNFNQLKQSVVDYTTDIIHGEKGASLYNKSISSAGNAINTFAQQFGFAGKAIGAAASAATKYVVAVNEQADELFRQYKDISRTGLVTGMDDVITDLQSMGYTMKEIGKMGDLLKANAETFAQFGGTAANGAKQFADLSREIQYSEFGEELQLMGMSVDDINKGTAGYMRIQQLNGQLQKQTQGELLNSTKKFLLEQDRLTKITGLTAEQQNKVMEAAYAEERFAAKQYQLQTLNGSEEAKRIAIRNEELVKTFSGRVGPEYARSVQKYLAGAMNDEDAVKFRRSLGAAADKIDAGVLDVGDIFDTAASTAEEAAKNWNQQALFGVAEKNIVSYSETVKLAGQKYGKTVSSGLASADKEQSKQKSGVDKGARNMVDISKAQRNQTMSLDKLINVGVNPVTKVLARFTETVESLTATPASKLMGGEGKLGGSAGPGTPADTSGVTLDKIIDFGGGTGDKAHFDKLNSVVRSSFIQMAKAYNETTGKKLKINSAYRSPEEQAGVQSGNNPKAAPEKVYISKARL